MASASDYTGLVTSQHADKPRFAATIAALVQPLVDAQRLLGTMPAEFDLDTATGVQLDAIGLWVGQGRALTAPLNDVYFSLDAEGLGLDQGYLKGPYDPSSGVISLADAEYRTLLRFRIAANRWDGTIEGAYAVWSVLFGGGLTLLIEDHGDMSMTVGVVSSTPLDAVTLALILNGYIGLKPSGVRINAYLTPSVSGRPFFGFDLDTSTVSGLDIGAWGVVVGTPPDAVPPPSGGADLLGFSFILGTSLLSS